MNTDSGIHDYVRSLADKAQEESAIFPVDRKFLERHLDEITSIDPTKFLYYNLEMVNDTYVNQLLVCLPEVWRDITVDDLINICKCFTNIHSYFTLIKFTYKYVEINIIEIVLHIVHKKDGDYLSQIIDYLKNQWNVLVKSESDLEDFENGFIDVNYNEWKYIKQRFLIDPRVLPAFPNLDEMKIYIARLINKRQPLKF